MKQVPTAGVSRANLHFDLVGRTLSNEKESEKANKKYELVHGLLIHQSNRYVFFNVNNNSVEEAEKWAFDILTGI